MFPTFILNNGPLIGGALHLEL